MLSRAGYSRLWPKEGPYRVERVISSRQGELTEAVPEPESERSILDGIDFDYAESAEGGDGAYGAFYELGASLGDQILKGLKDSGEAGIEKINEQGDDSTTDDGSATATPSE